MIVPSTPDFSFADKLAPEIENAFMDYILDEGMDSPEQELVTLCIKKKLTISTAESCTGGLVAKRITDIPGSSEVFKGSVVAYSNDLKVNILGVKKETLSANGAVSEETAGEMAAGIKALTGADVSVSITGIAGPGGGTESKPVGTVCFGFNLPGSKYTVTRHFSGSRERVRTFAGLFVLNVLRKELKTCIF